MNTTVQEISPIEAKQEMNHGALFVDVREEEELLQLSYDVSSIVHIPLSRFNEQWKSLPKDQELIMVCRHGRRSLIAANFLLRQGFSQVVNMQGGIIEWINHHFPVK
jgi:rhodanese-related sulfurtransferase